MLPVLKRVTTESRLAPPGWVRGPASVSGPPVSSSHWRAIHSPPSVVHSGVHRGQTETLVHAEAGAEAASWFPLLCFIINSCGSDRRRQKLPERTLCVLNHKHGRIPPSLPVLVLFVLSEVGMDSGASKDVSDG